MALLDKLHGLQGQQTGQAPVQKKKAKPGVVPRRRQGLEFVESLFDPVADAQSNQVVSVMAAIESGKIELVWSAVRKIGTRKINCVNCGDVKHVYPTLPPTLTLTSTILGTTRTPLGTRHSRMQ